MCGIFGVVDKHIERELAVLCTDSLTHRGPDGGDVWQGEGVTLGHRRLSILDLSDNGKQPMSYGDGRWFMVFNGEIYNFLEIRRELEAEGFTFRSDSDSEVILAAYIKWGAECQERFNGMWSFAIYDTREKSLFLSRDRFGVKPLFYAELPGGGYGFASEMKALLPLLPNPEPNYALFEYYKTNKHYEHTDMCLIRGIHRFPAGHSGFISRGGRLELTRWWNTLDHLVTVPDSFEEQTEMLRELFLDSIKLRMRSDVTVGTALSGGLDSSATICGMAQVAGSAPESQITGNALKSPNVTGRDLVIGGNSDFSYPSFDNTRVNKDWQHAYVAGFPGTTQDETRYARIVTDYLGIPNTFLDIDKPVSEADFLKQTYYFEELWTNPQIPMMEIYKKERQEGTLVSMDGHAADELFAGYEFDLLKALPDTGYKASLADEVIDTYFHQDELYQELSPSEYKKRRNRIYYDSMARYYGKKILCKPQVRSTDSSHPAWKDMDILNKVLYVSTHETIFPTLLRNYDRDSMASGVEIRMPFLDHRIVSFAFSIPWSSKVRGGYSKAIVRSAVEPFVPGEIVKRRGKMGFNAPLYAWMKGNYKEFFLDTTASAGFGNCALIENPAKARADLEKLLLTDTGSLDDAGRVWDQIQPYIWEQGLLKQSWK